MLDRYAGALLKDSSNTAADYADLLTWSPNITNLVRRPYFLGNFSQALAVGIDNNDLKRLSRQWVGPTVAQLDFPPVEFSYLSGITIANGYAYISDSHNVLRIVDINNPEQPTLAKQITGTHGYSGLKISGNHLYTLDGDMLYILDTSNPQQPTDVGQLQVGDEAKRLAVAGDHAYVLEDGDFLIVDASDPAAPTVTAKVPLGRVAIAAVGNIVAVSDYSGFHLIDAGNPAAPVVRGSVSFASDTELPERIIVTPEYAYVTTDSKLTVIDIRNLDTPKIVVILESLPRISDIVLEGTQLYVTSDNAVSRVDVSDPTAPVVTANMPMHNSRGNYLSAAVVGEFLYTLTFGSTLSAIDIDRAHGPVVESTSLPLTKTDEQLHFIATAGDRVYLQGTGYDFSIIDASDPAVPSLINTYESWLLVDATVIDDHAFTIDYLDKALSVTDVSDPYAPFTLENTLPLINRDIPFDALRDITQSGNQVFVAWGFDTFWGSHSGCPVPGPEILRTGGLFVIDVSTPTAPALKGQVCLLDYAMIVAVNGNHAFIALNNGLLQVVDVSNPVSPTLAGTVQLSAVPNFLAVSGNYVWASEGNKGIEIIDTRNPAAPAVTSRIDTAGYASSVSIDEHYAYVADGISGVLMLDISTPATPTIIASADTMNDVVSTTLVGDYFYAATRESIEVFKTLPAR